jgi:hypothetical protein
LYLVWQRSRQHAPKVTALITHFAQTLTIRPAATDVAGALAPQPVAPA